MIKILTKVFFSFIMCAVCIALLKVNRLEMIADILLMNKFLSGVILHSSKRFATHSQKNVVMSIVSVVVFSTYY